MTNKEYIDKKLRGTRRKNIGRLLQFMENDLKFFEAPCSGGNHLCCEGGLAEHTANVIENALVIGKSVLTAEEFKQMRPSIIIAAALHDLGKCGQYGKAYYVPNMVKDGRPTKADPVQRYKRSESKPYEQNKDLLHVDHPIRSLMLAEKFIELTEDEAHAILYHDGLYGCMKYEYQGHETKLSTIVHLADFWSSHFVEGKSIETNN